MENAADALKIAFAIFVFVIAITVTFSIISQAKSTADVVLYHTDETNFYDYEYSDSTKKNREVLISEVISTLHRYCKESIAVTVELENDTYMFDLNNKESILLDGTRKISDSNREKNLAKFINDILLKLPEDTKFEEKFVEATSGGIHETGEDGTEITISAGKEKIYITYTLIEK